MLSFVVVDLFAATVNALNGGILAQRPDHYRGNYFTMVGVLVLAVFGGIGGGITRDVLLNEIPGSLTDARYLFLCLAAGLVAYFVAYNKAQRFRETTYQFLTSFSLPWYAVVGVQKGLEAQLPVIGAVFLGVVGPTAGRYLIDVTCGVSAKQFVRGEWFIGTAVLTSIAYYILRAPDLLGLGFNAATVIAFAIGFVFRVSAVWWAWEEPMARVPASLLKGEPKRERLKDKMQPDWEPDLS
jgi:uncharacterized membrane protein YeiH